MIESVPSIKPVLAVSFPLSAAALIYLFRKHANIRECITLMAGVAQFAVVLTMAPVVLKGGVLSFRILSIGSGIEFGYRVDAFGLVFALTSSFLWILVSFYSIGYMRTLQEHAQTRYYVMFALAIFSAVSIALSENLVTFYVFYEALTLSTYWLVAHHEDPEALAAGRKYLAYLLVSGWFLFSAVVWTFALAGTTQFADGGILTTASASRLSLVILFVLFALGSLKAAWMPFHSWLPSAMVAPTPVSALLHAVAVVKAGVFGFVRIVCHVFGVQLTGDLGIGLWLGIVASFTMLVASFFAIGEDNLKRRLAYSTISQLSYILFGVALLSPYGIKGAMIHIPFHGFMKITLFLCAGAIMAITGKKAISQLAGIGRQMPITMGAFTIGAVGMCGAPPVAGFISKWFLCLGSLQSPHPFFLGVILISSLLDVIYFFPVVKAAFFSNVPVDSHAAAGLTRVVEWERPLYRFMIVPLGITAVFSIVFFFFPSALFIIDLVEKAAGGLFP